MDLRQKLVILILGITNTSLYPCSCDTIPFDYAVDSADEIFVGEIVGAEMFRVCSKILYCSTVNSPNDHRDICQ